jgi:hypothetical protein
MRATKRFGLKFGAAVSPRGRAATLGAMPASPALPSAATLRGWLDRRPALLLIFTTLVWGSNVVAARLAVGRCRP